MVRFRTLCALRRSCSGTGGRSVRARPWRARRCRPCSPHLRSSVAERSLAVPDGGGEGTSGGWAVSPPGHSRGCSWNARAMLRIAPPPTRYVHSGTNGMRTSVDGLSGGIRGTFETALSPVGGERVRIDPPQSAMILGACGWQRRGRAGDTAAFTPKNFSCLPRRALPPHPLLPLPRERTPPPYGPRSGWRRSGARQPLRAMRRRARLTDLASARDRRSSWR